MYENNFVGIGKVIEVTLHDSKGHSRQAKVTPKETPEGSNDPCLGCALDCEDACFTVRCCPKDREDGLNVIFTEVKE